MTISANATPLKHYVYLHRRNSDLSVFYVGKGKDRRAWGTTGRNKWWKSVAAKHGFHVQIIKDGLEENEALSLEIKMIVEMRKITTLVNLVDGGGGITGWKHSDEAKAKISAFNKGKKISDKALEALVKFNIGRKCTDESRLKMSLAKKGIPRPPLSPETRKKISLSHMGMRPSQESIRKMSASKVGKKVGKLSASYDHAIRLFTHPVFGVFEGTQGELILKYNLGSSCVSSVIHGKQKSVKGWKLS